MFRLLLAQYPPDTPTAIHSHEGWVVIGLLEGSERYTSWRRVDDGSTPLATLELVQDHHILPGEFGYLYEGPFNVHRQAAESEGAVGTGAHEGSGPAAGAHRRGHGRMLPADGAQSLNRVQGERASSAWTGGGSTPMRSHLPVK